MPKSKRKDKKISHSTPHKRPGPFRELLVTAWELMSGNYGGLVLTATMLQLFSFLILLGISINFQGPGDVAPFGRQEEAPLTRRTAPEEEEKSGLPPVQTAVFCVYAGLCFAAALLLRRRIAGRQFRIILYLQTPGLILAAYAVGGFLFRRLS